MDSYVWTSRRVKLADKTVMQGEREKGKRIQRGTVETKGHLRDSNLWKPNTEEAP